MKANEFMIGDWVKTNQCYSRIAELRGIEGIKFEDKFGYGFTPEVEPIPLTAEILEKNGWRNVVSDDETPIMQIETRCDAFWWDSKKCECGCERSVCDNGEECIEKTFFCKGIYYVHELQHALRLCGIDKTIEI